MGSPASPDYGPQGNAFNGNIAWVQIDVGDDDHDHLITPQERFNLAMARHEGVRAEWKPNRSRTSSAAPHPPGATISASAPVNKPVSRRAFVTA
jgi:hypothetical protein